MSNPNTIPEDALKMFEDNYRQIDNPSLDADFKLAVVILLAHIAQSLDRVDPL